MLKSKLNLNENAKYFFNKEIKINILETNLFILS